MNSVIYHSAVESIPEYAFQAKKHTTICSRRFITRYMSKTADERREILRKFIQARGLKIASWCKKSGVDKNSVYNFLNNHSQSLDDRTYGKLARTAQVQAWQISGDTPAPPSPTSILVSGDVQAGDFREAVQWEEDAWYPVDVPISTRFQGKARALEVRGSSMNIDYPDGSIAIWVPMIDFRPPETGDDVVVYCYRYDGMVESTLKQYRCEEDGKQWLWPRSHDPLHQTPINIDNPGDDISGIEVCGIVIGMYRSKHR